MSDNKIGDGDYAPESLAVPSTTGDATTGAMNPPVDGNTGDASGNAVD